MLAVDARDPCRAGVDIDRYGPCLSSRFELTDLRELAEYAGTWSLLRVIDLPVGNLTFRSDKILLGLPEEILFDRDLRTLGSGVVERCLTTELLDGGDTVRRSPPLSTDFASDFLDCSLLALLTTIAGVLLSLDGLGLSDLLRDCRDDMLHQQTVFTSFSN